MLSIITAIARNSVIGKGNELPWHLPADLKYFKETTSGKTVLMGKNTYESILGYLGKPLPNRKNIVLSDIPIDDPRITVITSLDEALALAKSDDIFIIGGRMVYQTFLPLVDRLYITWVESDIDGDVLFPEFDLDKFAEISTTKYLKDAKNPHDLTFAIYERVNK
ncbi:dihydrofolate reductase [Candidatus Saccharibacteria bacterium]|nr:dihydrofolate reductase [Candidatus Saccharibacteria bacterium]